MAPARKDLDLSLYTGRFAARLRKFREKAELTHEEVAEAVGVTSRTVYAWEQGTVMPRVDQLELLAEVLGLSSVQKILPAK